MEEEVDLEQIDKRTADALAIVQNLMAAAEDDARQAEEGQQAEDQQALAQQAASQQLLTHVCVAIIAALTGKVDALAAANVAEAAGWQAQLAAAKVGTEQARQAGAAQVAGARKAEDALRAARDQIAGHAKHSLELEQALLKLGKKLSAMAAERAAQRASRQAS
ncbi:hypothetical protein ABPG75_003505 [Micractinium tetrahymenae]